jgi:hypothetical protein
LQDLERLTRRSTSRLRRNGAAVKAGPTLLSRERASMFAIGAILVFLIIFALLNRIEFGRFD